MGSNESESLQSLARKWLQWDKDPWTRVEIDGLKLSMTTEEPKVAEAARNQLEQRLCRRIQFGTAGLRARMMAGFAYMNSLTVIQTSQGIADYLVQASSPDAPLSVLIGHDTRHNSAKYAHLAANSFKIKGINVLLFEDYVPTPFVSFGVRYFKASAGIMITASHNPAQDNGYKVYWSNGAQINTPIDQHIAASILRNLEPWQGAWETSSKSKNKPSILSQVRQAYIASIEQHSGVNRIDQSDRHAQIAGIYTPIHGVGWSTMAEVALAINYSTLIPVTEQVTPHPDFPTVQFPNPEEEGTLQLAYETADRANMSVVIANDPDADRFAAAERVNRAWHRFTGDQMGALLADYLITREASKASKTTEKFAMLCSAVSSGMLKKITKAAGPRFHFEETLTGFKWIGNRAQQLEEGGYTVLLGYEEALGYMFPSISYDKDGIVAASTYLFALQQWRRQELTPWAKLQRLYKEHGFHESINTYFVSPSPSYTVNFFDRIRNSDEVSTKHLGRFAIIRWRDVTRGSQVGDWNSKLPQDESSQMLTFHLEVSDDPVYDDKDNDDDDDDDDGYDDDNDEDEVMPSPFPPSNAVKSCSDDGETITFTIRASGTEPKVKIYLECASAEERIAQERAEEAFGSVVRCWILQFGGELRLSGGGGGSVISSSGVEIRV